MITHNHQSGISGKAPNPEVFSESETERPRWIGRQTYRGSDRIGLAVAALCCAAIIRAPAGRGETSPILNRVWPAYWIACPNTPAHAPGVYLFRKTFTLAAVPPRFVIHSSGDNRYQLFVDGKRVADGPAKGDLHHWRYETTDLAPFLHPGQNVLAAMVWNYGEMAPVAQITNRTGFILLGEGSASLVDTNSSWKVLHSPAIQMIPLSAALRHSAYFAVGPGERLDGRLYPWGWQGTAFDDSAWAHAQALTRGGPRGIRDSSSRWMLVPRDIPAMQLETLRLARVRRYIAPRSFHPGNSFLAGTAPTVVPAHSHVTLLLDQGYETTAYPELVVSGGRGAIITLTYAEALFDSHHQKGNRNQISGKHIEGYYDQFLPDGGRDRTFQPLWWRTYRYIQLKVVTAAQPLTIEDFRGEFTAYPFTRRARFESDDPVVNRIWEVGWHTARLCAHETYMDCPYYEQLQYVGDTRIQALISLYMTGDDRLVKNAIGLINDSRMPEGLTASRYPSALTQVIPPFSLFWIGMVHDLWWYHGDQEFLRQFLPNVRGVLDWFRSRMAPSGLLGRLPWWNFADWTKEFADGVPPEEPDGQSSILSLQFTAALREAAEAESAFGSAYQASHDRALATRITRAVYATCWDKSRGLLADTPAHREFSQHANILGVLTDSIPAAEQHRVMNTVLTDHSLVQCSYYFRFYLLNAMTKAGMGDEYIEQLGPWRHMLSLGLSTWAEMPEPTRSDCHAWSAHPDIGLMAIVAGIEPAAPGFAKVMIRPHLGSLCKVDAAIPAPQGMISVSYRRSGSRLDATVVLPPRVTGTFNWHGEQRALHGGSQQLNLP